MQSLFNLEIISVSLCLRREALGTDVDLGVISMWRVPRDKQNKINTDYSTWKKFLNTFGFRHHKTLGVVSSASGIARVSDLNNSSGLYVFFSCFL